MQKMRRLSLFAALILAGLALRVVCFEAGTRYLPVSSDESMTVLQAKRIRAGNMQIFFMGQPYMFPMESYLQAPLVNHLPRTPRGARLPAFLLGLAGVGCSLAILLRLHPGKHCWPGAVLLMFPSSYMLLHQAVYALPGYPALLFCGSACILAALYADRFKWCAPLAGLIAGIGFSTHTLILPALAAAGYFCLIPPSYSAVPVSGKHWRPLTAALFVGGVLLGLLPCLLGLWLRAGYHDAIFAHWSASEVLRRIWTPTIRYTLLTSMGIAPTPFPDNTEIHTWPALETAFLTIWLLLMIGGMIFLIVKAVKRRAPQPGAPALAGWAAIPFYAIIIMTILIFAISRRADSSSFRYLLPVVWAFPFILQHWYAVGQRRLKPIIGILAVILALLNVQASAVMISVWQTEKFTAKAGLPDLQPALDFLHRHDLRRCVASYGAAYRINFLTDEAILCAQPVNERFPNWPIPYKATVDTAPRAAYVLTDRIRFLKPEIFERHLRLMHIGCKQAQCGDFTIYYDFYELPRTPPSCLAPTNGLTITASHNATAAERLAQTGQAGGWTSQAPQTPGMYLKLQWEKEIPVHRIELIQTNGDEYTPETMDVSILHGGQWNNVLTNTTPDWDKFVFRQGHPVYGIEPRTLTWTPAPTHSLRLTINCAHSNHPWAVDTIRVFQTTE